MNAPKKNNLILDIMPSVFAVCRMDPNETLPSWALQGEFFAVTKTSEELSIVCDQSLVPTDVVAEKNWRGLKVRGPLDFALTGILASLAAPLAEAKISIFAISTFNTDYLLIKQDAYERALEILRSKHFQCF